MTQTLSDARCLLSAGFPYGRRCLLLALPLIICAAAAPPGCERGQLPGVLQPRATGCSGDCGYRVVNVYPHDANAFTQGLTWDRGELFESTGLQGRSSLRRVDLATGAVLQRVDFPSEYFGEGIAVLGDRIFMLTWQNRKGFVFDRNTFACLQEFSYTSEGWGLTTDGTRLIMSDGTALLRFLDPVTLAQTGSVQVLERGQPVRRLNELEYIHGEVYANVWMTDSVVRINPDTGDVLGWIHLAGLLTPQERAQTDVLNGIAYDAEGDRLFVTGKLWPKLFEIELLEAE